MEVLERTDYLGPTGGTARARFLYGPRRAHVGGFLDRNPSDHRSNPA
jgi:hypothetical protein